MKLLISNDDGISAMGVRSLANALAEAGHEVFVVCPDGERSATGHGLTLHHPIRAELVESIFHPTIKAWACSGTPADCVKLALWSLLDRRPDFVLAGINHGANLGTDVLYSGTVSAAMEGLVEGIPSLAFSLTSYRASGSRDFTVAAEFACALVGQLAAQPLPEPMLFNVNVPPVAAAEITGVTLTRQGIRRYVDVFDKRTDPRGKTYYWLSGEVIEDIEQPMDDGITLLPTDVQAIRDRYISLTPLQYNLTSVRGLSQMAAHQFEWRPEV
jgi:5'-nucleotidase